MKHRRPNQKGQALLLIIAVMGIFLIGALGLAIDTSQLFAHHQMAQVAADSAAQAAMLSIFQGVDTVGSATYFRTDASFTCTDYPNSTPCKYAKMNGFGGGSDVVTVSFPTTCGTETTPPCSTLASGLSQLQVSITRPVGNTLIRMLGASGTTTIRATGIAAIVNIVAPVPLLITDPKNSDTLTINGNTGIRICGGPQRSIQINSSASGYSEVGTSGIDLSTGGPSSSACDGTIANCCKGKGSDFGTFGPPTTNPGNISLGTTGNYLQPASPIRDPLDFVSAPSVPSVPSNAHGVKGETIHSPTDGCTSTCTEYYPGLYVGGLNLKGDNVIFRPGLYYMQGGGFTLKQINGGGAATAITHNLPSGMCSGCAGDANTGTGMVVYDTGPAGSTLNDDPAGGFNMLTQTNIFLAGSTLTITNADGKTVPTGPYYNILFFEDHNADANSHNLGQSATAQFAWSGVVYITNTLAIMKNNSSQVQSVTYNGGPSSNTVTVGEVIVGQLHMVGGSVFSMYLQPSSYLNVQQVALVGGGPHN